MIVLHLALGRYSILLLAVLGCGQVQAEERYEAVQRAAYKATFDVPWKGDEPCMVPRQLGLPPLSLTRQASGTYLGGLDDDEHLMEVREVVNRLTKNRAERIDTAQFVEEVRQRPLHWRVVGMENCDLTDRERKEGLIKRWGEEKDECYRQYGTFMTQLDGSAELLAYDEAVGEAGNV